MSLQQRRKYYVWYYHRKYYRVKNYCDSFQKHNQKMLSIPGNLMSGT